MGLMIAEVNGRGIVHFWVQDWAEDYWTGEATGLPSIPVARDWGRVSRTNDADLVITTIKMIPDEKMDIAEHLASYVSTETGQRIWDASNHADPASSTPISTSGITHKMAPRNPRRTRAMGRRGQIKPL